jgi:hypothetical protein
MVLKSLLMAIFVLLCHRGWSEPLPHDDSTSGTLRLVDVVDIRPGKEGSFVSGPGRYNPKGPILVIPDTSTWRIPLPDPTPVVSEATEEFYDLPRLPLLITKERPEKNDLDRDAFQYHGLSTLPDGKYMARITLNTPYRQLCSEYWIYRRLAKDEPDELVLVVSHGPVTREGFFLDPGEYRLERRVWRGDLPGVFLEEHYRHQRLRPSGNYEWSPEQRDEQELIVKIHDLDKR